MPGLSKKDRNDLIREICARLGTFDYRDVYFAMKDHRRPGRYGGRTYIRLPSTCEVQQLLRCSRWARVKERRTGKPTIYEYDPHI